MLWALFQDSDFKLVTSQKADDFTGRLQEAMLKQKMFDLVSAIVIVETYLRTCRKTISLAETQGSSMPWNTLMSSCFFVHFRFSNVLTSPDDQREYLNCREYFCPWEIPNDEHGKCCFSTCLLSSSWRWLTSLNRLLSTSLFLLSYDPDSSNPLEERQIWTPENLKQIIQRPGKYWMSQNWASSLNDAELFWNHYIWIVISWYFFSGFRFCMDGFSLIR